MLFLSAVDANLQTAALRSFNRFVESKRIGATTSLSNSTATTCLNIEIETRSRTFPRARSTTPV